MAGVKLTGKCFAPFFFTMVALTAYLFLFAKFSPSYDRLIQNSKGRNTAAAAVRDDDVYTTSPTVKVLCNSNSNVSKHVVTVPSGTTSPCDCSCLCPKCRNVTEDDDTVVPPLSPEVSPSVAIQSKNVAVTGKAVSEVNTRGPGQAPSGTNVIILATMRTGSSFVGEILFARNDNFFYLFEPGYVINLALNARRARFLPSLYVDMLTSLFHCNVTGHEYYMKWLKGQNCFAVQKMVPRLYDGLCSVPDPGIAMRPNKPVSADVFMRTCRETRNVAIKVVRIRDIGVLLPLIQSTNLKVIHLIRDPRGMITSQVAASNEIFHHSDRLTDGISDGLRGHLIEYCSHSLQNYAAGTYLPKYRDNYMLLRYEDIALDPHGAAQRVYNFTKLGAVPDNISNWIDEKTNKHAPGVFSTSRVSSKTYQSWRVKINITVAKVIEEVGECREMMKQFGYVSATDEAHLKNLTSSLVTKMPEVEDFTMYAQ